MTLCLLTCAAVGLEHFGIVKHGPQKWCFGGYNLPSAFILGAQKCGTTSTANELVHLVDLRSVDSEGRLGETHYFDRRQVVNGMAL